MGKHRTPQGKAHIYHAYTGEKTSAQSCLPLVGQVCPLLSDDFRPLYFSTVYYMIYMCLALRRSACCNLKLHRKAVFLCRECQISF